MKCFQLRLSYEVYSEDEGKSRRLVVLVKRVELQDHVSVSPYNKFFYWSDYEYATDMSNQVSVTVHPL